MPENPPPPENENGAMRYVPQWQEKLGWKLFPAQFVDLPEPSFPARDYLCTTVRTHFSLMDRLRILLSGQIRTEVMVATENVIGSNATAAGVSVVPPSWLSRKPANE